MAAELGLALGYKTHKWAIQTSISGFWGECNEPKGGQVGFINPCQEARGVVYCEFLTNAKGKGRVIGIS